MTVIIPDPLYNPDTQSELTASTKLSPSSTIGKFFGCVGSKVNFESIVGDQTRKDVARQLYLHAMLIDCINLCSSFDMFRIVPIESYYKLGPQESLGPVGSKKQTGQLVVYQVYDITGKISQPATFDLAVFWKDFALFDKLTLDYDTFDPEKGLSCQISVEMPVIGSDFEATFNRKVETTYNGAVIASQDLQEVIA